MLLCSPVDSGLFFIEIFSSFALFCAKNKIFSFCFLCLMVFSTIFISFALQINEKHYNNNQYQKATMRRVRVQTFYREFWLVKRNKGTHMEDGL